MLDKIIFRKIGPTTVFYIIRWRLVVVIFLHGTTYHRELVNPTWTDSRSSFATQNNLLRKFLVIFLIFVRAVIETGYIHHGSHVVINHSIRRIHTLSNGTCRVFTMADVLQETWKFRSTIAVPLIRHFITDTPHNHTWIVTILMNQIHQIFFCPFIKNFMITVLHFGRFPFIEWFRHNHHTHLITSLNQLRSGHIVWSTDGVTPHIL